jgi:hypothetical protein
MLKKQDGRVWTEDMDKWRDFKNTAMKLRIALLGIQAAEQK